MHPASTRQFLILGSLLAGLWLTGCQSTPPLDNSSDPITPVSIDWPASGELNLATDCPDTARECTVFRLSLLKNGLFHWQREANGLQQNAMGRWQLEARQLTLTTHASHPLTLTLDHNGSIYFHDKPLLPTHHSLFDQDVRTLSQLSRHNNHLMIAPCPGAPAFAVTNNSQSRLLASLYQPGPVPSPSRVLALLHLSHDRQYIILKQFISLEQGPCD